jgi:hypothetical protein
MLAWRDDNVPYEWVGYYLPAPCHRSDSWSGKRATLTDMGWGLAVIYVGQQTWSGTAPRKIVTTRFVTKRRQGCEAPQRQKSHQLCEKTGTRKSRHFMRERKGERTALPIS